ncbi:MAG: glycosyltransferase family 4 protein [Actinomycetota bacterium]
MADAPLVLIDADVLGRHRTGDETYVENLLRELGTRHDALRYAAVSRDRGRVPPGIEPVALPARNQLARTFWRLPALVRRLRPALTHLQYVVPPGTPGPTAVTIHDLSFEAHPDFFPPHDRLALRTLVPRAARRSTLILTVSEWTRRGILERYRVPAERVVVTPNGVDPSFGPEGPREDGSSYVLFVGAIQPRKDPEVAVRALPLLDPDLRLVLAGPDKLGADRVRRTVTELGLERRVRFLGYVEKPELARLYRGAECMVFPSRFEGFGLPVLEAMACGTPVVASRATSIPEIAGDAAVLVEPGSPEALAAGVRDALSRREELRALGLVRVKAFSWAETAARTAEAYRKVVGAS